MTETQRELYPGGGGSTTPIPDPTSLTTAAQKEAIQALRELLESKIDGRAQTVDTRLDDMDEALHLLQTIADRIPQQMEARVSHMEAVINQRFGTMDEKFRGIQVQFEEREVRARETATLLQTALAAALQAQKEAAGEQVKTFKESIDKSETAATKQIDGLDGLLQSTTRSINDKLDLITKNAEDKIADLKDRIAALDARGSNTASTSSGRDIASAQFLSIAFTLIGFAIVIAIALTR